MILMSNDNNSNNNNNNIYVCARAKDIFYIPFFLSSTNIVSLVNLYFIHILYYILLKKGILGGLRNLVTLTKNLGTLRHD